MVSIRDLAATFLRQGKPAPGNPSVTPNLQASPLPSVAASETANGALPSIVAFRPSRAQAQKGPYFALLAWLAENVDASQTRIELDDSIHQREVEETDDSETARELLEILSDFWDVTSCTRSTGVLHVEAKRSADGKHFKIEATGPVENSMLLKAEAGRFALLERRQANNYSVKLSLTSTPYYAQLSFLAIPPKARLGMKPVA